MLCKGGFFAENLTLKHRVSSPKLHFPDALSEIGLRCSRYFRSLFHKTEKQYPTT
jgi:hypothetical protein